MEKKTIGAFISALRKASGMTQRQLAEKLNVSDRAVSRWERDEAMPDLTLIPVIAEIFGVTSDEILRGQRKDQTEPETKYEVQKSEKQLRYLLRKTETDYLICSAGSIAVSLFGLIAAMIGNLGFLRAYIGFFVSCFFFIPGALSQVIFLIQGLRNLDTAECDEALIQKTRRTMVFGAETAFTVCAILFAACLPLIFLVHDTYAGLSAHSWASHGLGWGLCAAIICAIICTTINIFLGYIRLPDMTKPRNKLRLRTFQILAVVILSTLLLHLGCLFFLRSNMQLYTPNTKWETWPELKEYLETPMTTDGKPLELVSSVNWDSGEECEYVDKDGNTYQLYNHKTILVYEPDHVTPKYEYIHRNHSVYTFDYSPTKDHLPIYTFTVTDYNAAMQKLAYINLGLCATYVMEFVTIAILYRRKSKTLA